MRREIPYFTFVAGIVVGVAAGAFWASGGVGRLPTIAAVSGGGTTTTSTSSLQGASGAVIVNNQPAGMSVTLVSVTAAPPGVWAAIREVKPGGTGGETLGSTLGAAKVGGPLNSVVVPLIRATQPGTRYALELYRDDAGGTFDITKNSVYVDTGTGAPVIAYFTTTE